MRTLGLGLSRLICRNDKTEFVTELDIPAAAQANPE